MTQQVDSPSEIHISQPLSGSQARFPRTTLLSLLTVISALLLLFTSLLIFNIPQLLSPLALSREKARTTTHVASLSLPSKRETPPALQVPTGRSVIYEQQNKVYTISTTEGAHRLLTTPGYIYNRAISPLLTADGQLLYSGEGLWLTDIFKGKAQQIATLPDDQVITSLVLSSDKSLVAWSTAPRNGDGMISIYAGSLQGTKRLYYRQAANNCPCFRVFSFFKGSRQQTLLLTDDRGDHDQVHYGLWMLDLERTLPVLQSSTSQIPLALSPHGNTLLYAHQSGVVPLPTDRSVPDDMAALNYANSLLMATLDEKSGALGNTHELLLAPPELANIADYHWVLSPQFSPDGQTLTYTVFSSDTRSPFRRYHSLYTVQLGSAGATLHADKPQLLATSTSSFVELGPWLDNHILTFYADGALHALDIRSGASTTLAQLNTYARIVAVIG